MPPASSRYRRGWLPASSASVSACWRARISVGAIERRLLAVGDAHEHRVHGDDRLAAADVALQQPVHRAFVGHVGGDFLRWRPAGRPSARTATAARCGRRSRPIAASGGARKPTCCCLRRTDNGELQDEQLLEHEPPPGALQLLAVCGEWIAGTASTSGMRSYCFSSSSGNTSSSTWPIVFDRACDDPPHLILRRPSVSGYTGSSRISGWSSAPSSHVTRGWDISHRPPRCRGLAESSTCWPSRNFSRMNGWLNHMARR